MSTTLTLKNIPQPLHAALKRRAKAHHRSLNSEIMVCLEESLMPKAVDTSAIIASIRASRVKPVAPLTDAFIEKHRRAGAA
jgi:plasmid stability protein